MSTQQSQAGGERPPGRFRIDLHVHTGRYSQCAELVDPYEIGRYALANGLAGVVLTEHDISWQDEELELLRQSSPGVRIYGGIEVSARGCHLVVIGAEHPELFERGAELEEIVSLSARSDAAVILAHPYRDADPCLLPVELVDAVEVGSTSFSRTEAEAAVQLARQHGKPRVAASDAHTLSHLGWAWTELARLPENELELAAAIRAGAGQAVVPNRFPGEQS